MTPAERVVEDLLMQLSTPMLHDLTIHHGNHATGSDFPDLLDELWAGPGGRTRGWTPNAYSYEIMDLGVDELDTWWGVVDGEEVQNAELQDHLCIPNDKLYTLAHLTLRGDFILWEANALSPLESLEVRSLGPTGPTITQLITILRASCGLVTLTLDRLRLNDSDTLAHHTAPVELSRLSDFALSRVSVRILCKLLAHIRIPTCRRLKLNSTHKPEVRVLDSQTAHLGPPIQAILSATGTANIHLTSKKIEISAGLGDAVNVDSITPGHSLYLYFPSDPSPGPVDWLNRVLSSMIQPPTINLIIEVLNTSSELIPLPFDMPRHVDQPCIMGGETNAAMWIQLLSEPLTLANGEAQWTLPRMTHLVFHSCSPNPEALSKMIGRRYGGRGESMVTDQQDDVGSQLQSNKDPVPLKQLQISGYNPLSGDDLEKLESIVGSEACVWDDNDKGEGL
ncbi:hypothetical protein FRB98_003100 [Tulasnella sp. 332]|nr:hypothetical protein FRB98_003100 [Tulasnella sp. 332]